MRADFYLFNILFSSFINTVTPTNISNATLTDLLDREKRGNSAVNPPAKGTSKENVPLKDTPLSEISGNTPQNDSLGEKVVILENSINKTQELLSKLINSIPQLEKVSPSVPIPTEIVDLLPGNIDDLSDKQLFDLVSTNCKDCSSGRKGKFCVCKFISFIGSLYEKYPNFKVPHFKQNSKISVHPIIRIILISLYENLDNNCVYYCFIKLTNNMRYLISDDVYRKLNPYPIAKFNLKTIEQLRKDPCLSYKANMCYTNKAYNIFIEDAKFYPLSDIITSLAYYKEPHITFKTLQDTGRVTLYLHDLSKFTGMAKYFQEYIQAYKKNFSHVPNNFMMHTNQNLNQNNYGLGLPNNISNFMPMNPFNGMENMGFQNMFNFPNMNMMNDPNFNSTNNTSTQKEPCTNNQNKNQEPSSCNSNNTQNSSNDKSNPDTSNTCAGGTCPSKSKEPVQPATFSNPNTFNPFMFQNPSFNFPPFYNPQQPFDNMNFGQNNNNNTPWLRSTSLDFFNTQNNQNPMNFAPWNPNYGNNFNFPTQMPFQSGNQHTLVNELPPMFKNNNNQTLINDKAGNNDTEAGYGRRIPEINSEKKEDVVEDENQYGRKLADVNQQETNNNTEGKSNYVYGSSYGLE